MTDLRIWVGILPPSSNTIYIRHPRGKGRVLSDQARQFKIKSMKTIQMEGKVALLQLEENTTYQIHVAIFFEQVENKDSKTGNRYKKIDLSNRLKLIEDTVAEAVGLDDRHNFRVILEKHCDPDNPGYYVTLTKIPEKEVGLTKENYERLRLQQPQHHRARRSMLASRFLVRSSRTESTDVDRSD
jgi:Holliday junction resolvase RusA-like endonuclease